MTIDGIINLNKPQGKTSFQMVALTRKLSGERKVGHSGTLDPDATGVLPILLGQATKLARYLTEAGKIYQAEIRFGSATTTYDSSGTTTQQGDTASLTLEKIKPSLNSFSGIIEQIPPMYSAIKYQGRPLYHLARTGIEIPRMPRQVTISRLDVQSWQNPVLSIEVECSKGTYIRSLAHDLGQALGCGAHLSKLSRLRSGPFCIEEAISVAQLQEAFQGKQWKAIISPMDTALPHLTSITVDEASEADIAHGRPFPWAEGQEKAIGNQCRAYSTSGRFLALVHFDAEKGLWQPDKVFAASP
ncbi:MAG: tRNA pseudouridine(55) synthase TruB [Dehalococcoidia bacterium]|nr:tRNA pseudouridine(55) synthase TruB [Dehalococcoidia bacterium]